MYLFRYHETLQNVFLRFIAVQFCATRDGKGAGPQYSQAAGYSRKVTCENGAQLLRKLQQTLKLHKHSNYFIYYISLY